MVRISVIGVGCVGEAVVKSITNKTDGYDVKVVPYDKYKNIGTFENVLDTDIALLCLPTPYSNTLVSYDKSAIYSVCSQLAEHTYQGLVVIKSTVEPETCEEIAAKHNLSVCHNPEFLSAKTAYEDFHNQNHIIIGTTNTTKQAHLESLIDFYQKYYPAKMTLCTSTESESMKIFCNNFYSVKIQFFNELYLLCQSMNVDYKKVRHMMLENGWINPMHTDVPGHDGQLGYSGLCFPKDTNALLSFMQRKGTQHQVLEAVIQERDTMRDDQHRLYVTSLEVIHDKASDKRYDHSAA